MMKKTIIFCMAAVLLFGCSVKTEEKENYSDEMKIAHTVDLSEDDGADSVEREGDQKESPYFKHPDFYHMKSTDTLTLLPKFKTMQQTSEWSCGVDAALMVLQYYGKLGKHNEETLVQLRTNKLKSEATSLQSMIQIFEGVGGFQIHSTYDYRESDYDKINLRMIQDFLKKRYTGYGGME